LRTRAIPERLRGVFTTRRYTNTRLPYLTCLITCHNITQLTSWQRAVVCRSEGLRPVDTEDERDGWASVIERVGREILLGGEWRPASCEANTHLAVIIPCRDRDTHLRIMLRHFIPVLQRQLVHFRIFVVEQVRRGSSVLCATAKSLMVENLRFLS